MLFLQNVYFDESDADDEDGGTFFLPILGTNKFAKLQWRAGEETEDFLKRHGLDGTIAGYDHFKIPSSLGEDDLYSVCHDIVEVEFHFYSIVDMDKNNWYLVSRDRLSWEDIEKCFCIPKHTFNIIELCRHFACMQNNTITRGS